MGLGAEYRRRAAKGSTLALVADPHILYVILSLDAAGLVLWVAYTLLRMPVATPYVPSPDPSPESTKAP